MRTVHVPTISQSPASAYTHAVVLNNYSKKIYGCSTNLFLHYAFDQWMSRNHPGVLFERYADDVICHCKSEAQAEQLRAELDARLAACKLQLHPEKTKIVYCKDDNRRVVNRPGNRGGWLV
ncbi:reverse transcriptase domain-containing protein [Burkholderia sp. BCC0405]|uniref:reverse transcriptase domain-containing protein n=1 Tax=Burkholderia sp. BCC0405 TaxID=2676298 RepID=UPI00158BA045|nr:reverse transcriptase domain-containing protein [Burkholderia sp. BCC0405]